VVIDNVSAIGYMKENEGKMKIAGELTSDEQLAFVFPPNSDLTWSINAALLSSIALHAVLINSIRGLFAWLADRAKWHGKKPRGQPVSIR
jgi:hypothetical protein